MSENHNNIRTKMSLQTIMNRDELHKLQSKYSNLAGIFALCMNEDGKMITDFSGDQQDIDIIKSSVGMEFLLNVYKKIIASPLEEQIIEDTAYSNVKVAAIRVMAGQVPIINWIVCGVFPVDEIQTLESEERSILRGVKKNISEEDFYNALDILRMVSVKLIQTKFNCANFEAESMKNKSTNELMINSLKRIEAMAEIVQLLECDKTIEEILQQILKVTVTFLGISSGQIVQLQRDTEKIDIIAEFCNNGITSYFDQTRNLERPSLLKYEKTYVVSSNSVSSQEEKESLKERHIKGFVAIPMCINGQLSMYSCFSECKKEKEWNVDEIKFMSDIAKIIQSIILKRIQKNSLVSSYASLEGILDHIGCAIYVEDEQSKKMLFTNNILKSTFEQEFKEGNLTQLFTNGKSFNSLSNHFEIHYIQKDKWYDIYLTTILWVDGRKANLCVAYDITDKKIYQRKIEQQAYTDFLTGLYNRMCCEKDLARFIDQAKNNGEKGALLYLDLDDFKHINDGLGHQYGDVLLKDISHSLQRIIGIGDTCYRMGGDEFVIIIPPESYCRSQFIIDSIKNIFSKPWFLKDADYYCTMSMGVVDFPSNSGDVDSVQDLIKKADIAMYEAKKSGKNRVAQYSNQIHSSSNKRLDMEKNMRDATVDGYHEFEVYYQPIIDISENHLPCVGAEALIRWNSQVLGFVPPADFIPLAEYLGLINPIGNYVLKEACKACKFWNENGHPNFKVNVNLSVVQLLQADIAEIVDITVKEVGINPRNLTLEVTEGLAINDMKRMKEILSKIKESGVRIALDDFGSGYSSLNHIREIPLDVIKVDQSFVTELADDAYSQSFIKLICELAQTIGVSICIEGIETKEQYKVLEGMKVKLVQGYYFDRPMTKEKFQEKYV